MATALITGASAGLGTEFAWTLASGGRDLVLVARSVDRLERLAESIRHVAGVAVEVLVADLSTREGMAAVAERVSDRDRAIDLLVNNAGLGLGTPFVGGDIEKELAALDVMVRAVMVLSHAAADAMVARGRGAILNVSSVASWLGNGTYAAHKAWVTAFSEGLATELRGTGVTVTAVLPGLTRTEFHERAALSAYDELPDLVWLDAASVVDSALAGVRRRAVLVTPSARYATLASFVRIAPRSVVRRLAGSRRTPKPAGGASSADDAPRRKG